MGAFFTALLAKFSALASWLILLVKGVFLAGWLIFTDLFCWLLAGLFALIQTVLNELPGPDGFALFNPATYVSGLPADLVNMIGLIRIGEALAIILAAILIKLTLQIIPFTRLGS
jgi:hypothetical protein